MELLVSNGAQLNVKDMTSWTPLFYAVAQQQLEVVKLLLASGADPNVHDKRGWTPLRFAMTSPSLAWPKYCGRVVHINDDRKLQRQ